MIDLRNSRDLKGHTVYANGVKGTCCLLVSGVMLEKKAAIQIVCNWKDWESD